MQQCVQCGQDVLINHDLTKCYHCRKLLCPECEDEGGQVVICKQCVVLRSQGKEALIGALVNQLMLWGFQLVESETDALSVRQYTTYQHRDQGLSVMITE